MKIPEYISLKKKEEAFVDNYKKIKSIKELKDFLNDAKSFKNHIFRGVCEAKYQNFTSAQRKYFINDFHIAKIEITNLIQKQINYIKEEHKTLIDDYYKSLGIQPNDLLYLGISQHYGGISPLLDFTEDFKTALFFLTDGAVFPPQGAVDIENYSSLYYISNDCLLNFNSMISKTADGVSNRIKDIKLDAEPNGDILISAVTDFNYIKSLLEETTTSEFELYFLIPNNKKALNYIIETKKHTLRSVFAISNLNIVAQKGCFILYLPKKATAPFEKSLHCVDIHKSLIPYIIEYTGLKRSDIYPDEYDMVSNAYNKVLRSVLDEKK